jgi:hypothetical protein
VRCVAVGAHEFVRATKLLVCVLMSTISSCYYDIAYHDDYNGSSCGNM